LQLRAADCDRLSPLLGEIPQILEVIPHAGSLHIRLRSGASSDDVMGQIRALAGQHRLSVDKLQTLQADLEDVFVAMLEDVEKESKG
jgi:hypothetical protein